MFEIIMLIGFLYAATSQMRFDKRGRPKRNSEPSHPAPMRKRLTAPGKKTAQFNQTKQNAGAYPLAA